jgi:2-haloacid dehalogenase
MAEGTAPIYVFDAYGTLFDVHAAVREHADALGEAGPRLSEIWRAKQLEYTWIYAGLGQSLPFLEVTRLSLLYALDVCGQSAGLAPQLLESYQRLPVFPEVPGTLRQLKLRGATLAILSNSDTDMLDDLVTSARLEGVFDHLISARVAGTFKPSPRVYALATEVYSVRPGDITFVSSNRWDAAGAKTCGLRTVWINRRQLPDEYPDWPADRIANDVSALLEL